MAKYRKIDPRIWNDAKFRQISDSGKLLFLFLLTHPHMTSLGAMRATIPGLAAELGWKEKALAEALAEALAKGIAKHDPEASLLWLPNFLKYNGPESPNVVKSWVNAVDMLPECGLLSRVFEATKAYTEGLGEGFRKALPKAFAKGMPYQEQAQEPEQEPEPEEKNKPKKSPQFKRPTIEEVTEYADSRSSAGNRKVDPIEFMDHYEANGWVRGKTAIKDWRACLRTWERGSNGGTGNRRPPDQHIGGLIQHGDAQAVTEIPF